MRVPRAREDRQVTRRSDRPGRFGWPSRRPEQRLRHGPATGAGNASPSAPIALEHREPSRDAAGFRETRMAVTRFSTCLGGGEGHELSARLERRAARDHT